mgnify:CR=1 FL=1
MNTDLNYWLESKLKDVRKWYSESELYSYIDNKLHESALQIKSKSHNSLVDEFIQFASKNPTLMPSNSNC